jgi:cytochrome c oxidase subunit 2
MTMLADLFPFPEQASTVAGRIDAIYFFIIGITVFVGTVTAVALIYFAIRYRRVSDDFFPKPIIGSKVLETSWAIVMTVVFLFMFLWSAYVYIDVSRPPADAIDVYVVGRQWMWKCQHPDGQRETNELHVPVGQPVRLILTSEDVIHDFFVPDFRTKMDAVPGRYTHLWFQATRPGRYHLFCSQYCGTDHARMIGWVVAQDPAEHQAWLSSRADLSLALKGRRRFLQYQCVTCHSADAQAKAPVLEDLYNRQVRLQDGRTVLADESYLRESILRPRAKVAAGYEPIMPAYQGVIDEQALLELIAFIKALKPGETPRRNESSTAPQSDPNAKEPRKFPGENQPRDDQQ